MNLLNIQKTIFSFACACTLASTATAMVGIDTVYVGDIGNSADASGTSYGAVDYGYYIGTYEVTNNQYASFLNAVASSDPHELYATGWMGVGSHGGIARSGQSGSYSYQVVAGMGNKPVTYVSFWDAARFTNWLTSGDTEQGVYTLNGVTNPVNTSITRNGQAWAAGGVAVASEDEWYKAAYYQPASAGGDSTSYWDYPNAKNSLSTADAHFNSVSPLKDVGTYTHAPSYYGTFDQAGNAREITDTIRYNSLHSGQRVMLGGGHVDGAIVNKNSYPSYTNPDMSNSSPNMGGNYVLGFRVTSLAPIPEPSSFAAIFGCLALVLARMRRKGPCTL